MTLPQTLILATRNQGKVKELREPLARFGFDVQSLPDDFPEVPETGSTFEENALIKARAVADALGFTTRSYFIQCFRAVTGQTPTQWRGK